MFLGWTIHSLLPLFSFQVLLSFNHGPMRWRIWRKSFHIKKKKNVKWTAETTRVLQVILRGGALFFNGWLNQYSIFVRLLHHLQLCIFYYSDLRHPFFFLTPLQLYVLTTDDFTLTSINLLIYHLCSDRRLGRLVILVLVWCWRRAIPQAALLDGSCSRTLSRT